MRIALVDPSRTTRRIVARMLSARGHRSFPLPMSAMRSSRSKPIEALDSGADDFIGKPPLAEELYARLRAAERILSMQRDLIRLATINPLTGLSNLICPDDAH